MKNVCNSFFSIYLTWWGNLIKFFSLLWRFFFLVQSRLWIFSFRFFFLLIFLISQCLISEFPPSSKKRPILTKSLRAGFSALYFWSLWCHCVGVRRHLPTSLPLLLPNWGALPMPYLAVVGNRWNFETMNEIKKKNIYLNLKF